MAAGLNTRILVFENKEALSRAVADRFVEVVQECCASGNSCSVALSGGVTPQRCYALLGTDRYRNQVDWTAIHVFWADERSVPPVDNDSNYKLAYDLLLSVVPIPEKNIHRVKGEKSPIEAAQQYESEILAFFGSRVPVFDLVVLGAGIDGHTASLFSASAALREHVRFAVPVIMEPPQLSRVTLTLPVLNNANHVLVLASGQPKALVVQEIFENGNARQYPAGLVRPVHGSLEWFIDREAATLSRSLLKE